MSFCYETVKKKQDVRTPVFWTSYADIATLNFILFLFLYTITTVRSNTLSLSKAVAFEQQRKEIERLEQQVKVYEARDGGVPEHHVRPVAPGGPEHHVRPVAPGGTATTPNGPSVNSAQEVKPDQATLQATQMSHKQRLKLSELSNRIASRGKLIEGNKREIASVKRKLEKSINEVRTSEKTRVLSKRSVTTEIARLKTATNRKISALQTKNQEASRQLKRALNDLREFQIQLEKRGIAYE